MTILSTDQLTQYARQAGFSGTALQTIVAIALAESGGRTDAYNENDPYGGSYGVLQINGSHGLSTSCTYDPACSFRFAYQLSRNGTYFKDWGAYTDGRYRSYLGGTVKNWYDYTPVYDFGKTFSWATYPVQGEDIPMPMDTPVTALFPGTVTNQYYNAGGGEVIIKADDPTQLHNIPYYYFVHLDSILTQQGQHVTAGQEVGLSGGQNVGGLHPSAPNYSSGEHLEFGLSKTNEIPYTLSTITPDLNPDWLLDYAKSTGLSSLGSGGCTCPAGYHAISGVQPGSGTITMCVNNSNPADMKPCQEQINQSANFFGAIQNLIPWLNDPVRIIKLIFGILLIGGAIFLIASPQEQIARTITSGARKVGIRG